MTSSRSSEKPSTQEQIGALVDDRLLTLLREVFIPVVVKPGVPMDQVQYDAGTQRVLSFLAECQNQSRAP
jgi:hypothetical protein